MALAMPIDLQAWIEKNRAALQPPVGNVCLHDGDFLVMVVGGPNARTDYHVNPGEELFYQVQGDVVLRVLEDGAPRDVPIKQGQLFLLPAGVPHSPQRPAGTVGLVVEQPRAHAEDHHLRWFCDRCGAVLHDVAFRPVDLGKQIKAMLTEFAARADLRTCKGCGATRPA